MTELIAVRAQHRFDEHALEHYLTHHLEDATAPFTIAQFQGGQSNPTFLVTDAANRRYVLRKKPPGAILQSAHAVEREYAAMRALGPTGVPVPAARLLCEDPNIIGTAFYVMDYIDGRVLTDLCLESIARDDRAAYYFAMADGLASLHKVDWRRAGLENFGKPDAYIARQIGRWTRQYLASDPEPNADMELLITWLPAHTPPDEPATIAHGDYRLGNLMFAPTRSIASRRAPIRSKASVGRISPPSASPTNSNSSNATAPRPAETCPLPTGPFTWLFRCSAPPPSDGASMIGPAAAMRQTRALIYIARCFGLARRLAVAS